MRFYFSGIGDEEQIDWLRCVADPTPPILIDVYDFLKHQAFFRLWPNAVALDSGGFRLWRQAQKLAAGTQVSQRYTPLSADDYREIATSYPFAFVVQQDDPTGFEATQARWEASKGTIPNLAPVWTWGDNLERLLGLLAEAPLVAIGGLAPVLRRSNAAPGSPEAKAHDKNRESVLRQLVKLTKAHPQKMHLLGISWPKAVTHLAPYLASADSSIWLRGARKGTVIIRHSRAGHLLEVKPGIVGLGHLNRAERCIESARAIHAFTEGHPLPDVAIAPIAA